MAREPGPRRSLKRTLVAAWRMLCYKLAYHHVFAIALKHWLWVWVALPPLAAWIGQLAWSWAALTAGLAAIVLAAAEGARRKQYVLFVLREEPGGMPGWAAAGDAAPDALRLDEPLRCWASGRMGVEGSTRAIAGERASVSWVRTREHVVMAQVRRKRFLLLAPPHRGDVGYWYAFFHPRAIESVRLGTLYSGFTMRPGLALSYTDGDGNSLQLYLAFETGGARQRLLADLRRDVGEEAF